MEWPVHLPLEGGGGVSVFFYIYFYFIKVGPICYFLFLLGLFKPRNKLFCPDFNFIYLK